MNNNIAHRQHLFNPITQHDITLISFSSSSTTRVNGIASLFFLYTSHTAHNFNLLLASDYPPSSSLNTTSLHLLHLLHLTMMPSLPMSNCVSRQIELRFSANGLANKDFLSLSDPFLVCHTVRNGVAAERIGRTETVKDDLNPVWATTICFTYNPTENGNTTILIDIFDRDSPDDSHLTKHDFLGRATFRISHLLEAEHRRLDIPLIPAKYLLLPSATSMSLVTRESCDEALPRNSSSRSMESNGAALKRQTTKDLKNATTTTRATKKVRGTVSVVAEELSPTQGMHVVFRVSSAMMRDAGPFGRRVTQFYEIQRQRREGNDYTWSCVYRSKDGVNVDRNNYVVFDEMSVTEQQLHNMDPQRRLRIAFYKRYTRQQHELISYINTSLKEIMDSRKSEKASSIPMEGTYEDDDGLGHVIVKSVEKWVETLSGRLRDSGTLTVNLRADHFLHKKFVSYLNDSPNRVRKLRQLPTFITMH